MHENGELIWQFKMKRSPKTAHSNVSIWHDTEVVRRAQMCRLDILWIGRPTSKPVD